MHVGKIDDGLGLGTKGGRFAGYNSLTKAATSAPLRRSLTGSPGRAIRRTSREDTKQYLLVFDTLPLVLVVLLSLEHRVHALHYAFPPIYTLLSTLRPPSFKSVAESITHKKPTRESSRARYARRK
jgi:hypothetical protein